MIVPFTKINKAGQKTTYWTHSSFLDEQQVDKIKKSQATSRTIRNYLALAGVLIGLKASSIPLVASKIPKNIPVLGVVALSGLAFFGVGHLLFVSGKYDKQVMSSLESSTIPLWKDKSKVLNLGRLYFHLDDANNNRVDLLHHGLTPEGAARIFPDLISGPAPKAPQPAHHDHGHGQGHGHGHKQEKAHH